MKQIFYNLKYFLKRYPFLIHLYRNAMFIKHALNDGFWRALLNPIFHTGHRNLSQSLIEWEVAFPQFRKPDEMVVWLKSQGIRLDEGKHTIYLPPQEKLMDIIPLVVGFYPPNSGFKILKDFRSPRDANYVGLRSRISLHSRLIGKPQTQLIAANFLHSSDLAPRIWDVTGWKSIGKFYTVFVVSHVDGHCPSMSQCVHFKKRLEEILKGNHLRFVHPEWDKLDDFKCPSCNGNLLQPSGDRYPKYIDFQNFVMKNPRAWSNEIVATARNTFHFGQGRPFRGDKYLYQSVPEIAKIGKR